MTQPELYDAISIAFYNLAQVNQMLYDYWLMELYDGEGGIIEEQWNEANLNQMEKDVMNQTPGARWDSIISNFSGHLTN